MQVDDVARGESKPWSSSAARKPTSRSLTGYRVTSVPANPILRWSCAIRCSVAIRALAALSIITVSASMPGDGRSMNTTGTPSGPIGSRSVR